MCKALLASLLLAFTLALAACYSTSNLDKANGTWLCDAKATMALRPEFKDYSEPHIRTIEGEFHLLSLNVDAKANTIHMLMRSVSEGGEFTVISDSGKTLVLSMQDDTVYIDFTTDDSIILYSEKYNNLKTAFTRKK